MKKLNSLMLVAVTGLSTLAAAKDVATVNGKAITEEEYKKAVDQLGPQAEMVKTNPQVRPQFLDHIIDYSLLADKAKNDKIEDTDRFKGLVETAKRDILAQLYLEKYVADQSTEPKLKEYFEKNKKKFTEKEVKAVHILFDEKQKAEAEKVLKEVLAKNDFDAMLKKYATDPNGSKGGDLNWFKPGRMVPEFEKAAFSTEKGKVYPQLVKTQFGYHIIKVADIRGGDSVKFEDKKSEVEQDIRMNAKNDLVKSLRDKAQVKVNDDTLTNMKF
ncbi:MAG: peptidylprolyl isomerase [Chitinophagaceae bacterium]|nr:peptidylprolyl isomerase [Oligoflexus sp.]